jgi:hypothetical protein
MRDYDIDDFPPPPTFEGISTESLPDAFERAVNAAKKPHGTWLRVVSIEVLSVDDPQVGGYKVVLGPTG